MSKNTENKTAPNQVTDQLPDRLPDQLIEELCDSGKKVQNQKPLSSEQRQDLGDANAMLGVGAGLGAYSAATLATLGTVCTACIVAAPALIGYGAYKRRQIKKSTKKPTS